MIGTYKKIFRLLTPTERRSAVRVFLVMLASAILDVVGVASIMPFVAVLGSPEIMESNQYLKTISSSLGVVDQRAFIMLLGLATLAIFISSLMLKALNAYSIVHFVQMRMFSFSNALLVKYTTQPYEFFLNRNSANLSQLLFSEVSEVVNNVILPSLKVVSSVIVIFSIFLLLLFVDPVVIVFISIVLGGGFLAIYLVTRRLLSRLGAQRAKDNSARFIIASETLGGIKELRLMGRERTYIDRFHTVSKRFAQQQSVAKVIGDVPHFAVQAIAFGGILVLVLYLTARHSGLEGAMPLIALYAFAGYRLLPAFQELFKNATQLNYMGAGLDNLLADMERPSVHRIPQADSTSELLLDGDIALNRVCYAYKGDRKVLDGLTFEIPKGSCVALVGTTGAGKSTTIDVVMGLLQPDTGYVSVGGLELNSENLPLWQRNIGYVPQSIYLADASIAENIAFGVPSDSIDMAAVERAARTAHIHDFVTTAMPQGYQSRIGERGARISGGQRQRIGIARALYHNPQVLVFDEATSALDNATESAVMEAVSELAGQKTIILVAHRLTTVKKCDVIFLLEDGRLAGQGTFDYLSASSAAFARIATNRP